MNANTLSLAPVRRSSQLEDAAYQSVVEAKVNSLTVQVTEIMNQINNLESKSDSPDLNIPILIEKASSKANDDFQGSLLELRLVF